MVKKGFVEHEEFGEIHEVYMNVYLSVLDIRTVANEFHITGFINVFWCEHLEPEVYGSKDFAKGGDAIENMRLPFPPHKLFGNAREVEMHKVSFRYFPKDEVICQTYQVSAELQESFELSTFPMDRQQLKILFCGRGPQQGWCWLVDPPDWLPKPSPLPNIHKPLTVNWSPAITEYTYFPGIIDYSGQRLRHGTIVLRIQRKTFYYFLHDIFPLALVVASSYSFRVLDFALIGDRLAIVTTLFLAAIAFDLVITGNTPKVSYPTRLDFYTILAYITICAHFVDIVIVSAIEDDDAKDGFEFVFCTVSGVIWTVATLGFTIAVFIPWFRTTWDKIDRIDRPLNKQATAKTGHAPELCAGSAGCGKQTWATRVPNLID